MEGSMSEYQLEIKQIVDYPRCRIYRHFIQNLMADRSIRVSGGSGLFYYTVLCNYANFRTSYLRIDGIGYTVYPGEWICTVKELTAWFRTRFQRQAVSILDEPQKRHLISYLLEGIFIPAVLIAAMFMGCTFNAVNIISEKEDGVAFVNEILPVTPSQYILQKVVVGFLFGSLSSIATSC